MGKLYLALRSHVPVELKPSVRKYEFTTDLEIMSALRGGLAAHVKEMNELSDKVFPVRRGSRQQVDKSVRAKPKVVTKSKPDTKSKPAKAEERRITVRVDRGGKVEVLEFREVK
jgi:hypothetical protein